ncbi:unnamed protein product [Umbelopsis ramanniana]
MSERQFNIPTVEQIEQHKRKSKATNYFQQSKATGTTEESASTTSTPNEAIEIPPQLNSSAAASSTISETTSQNTTPPPQPVATVRRLGPNTILVNQAQRGNPILQHVRNVPWEYDDIKADYTVGQTTCVLYLSLRYHRLHPDYIYDRMGKLAHQFVLRILLVFVDIDNHQDSIRELTKSAIIQNFTIMLAWSHEEAGRYLETYKAFEGKPPDIIKEKSVDDYMSKLTECLTQVRTVNKTDVLTLRSTFGSLNRIINAPTEALALCPGFGEQKVRRLQQAFTQPFIINPKGNKRQKKN